jgi:hypothetical protein
VAGGSTEGDERTMTENKSPPTASYRSNSRERPDVPSTRTRWQRFVDWALNREPPLVTRYTKTEILEFARAYLEPRGEWIPEVGCGPRRRKGRVYWRVITNVPNLGGHTQLEIDDETMAILRHHIVPY